ncbi:MAG: 4Fe-4S dicluster domain-containing protein, partial [Sutterella sp.]
MSKHMPQDVRVAIDACNPAVVRDEALCVKCRLCAGVCNDYIGVNNNYDLAKTGDKSVCIHCGQCIAVCPVGSLKIKPEWEQVAQAIADPDKIVIFSTSPSVRVGLG